MRRKTWHRTEAHDDQNIGPAIAGEIVHVGQEAIGVVTVFTGAAGIYGIRRENLASDFEIGADIVERPGHDFVVAVTVQISGGYGLGIEKIGQLAKLLIANIVRETRDSLGEVENRNVFEAGVRATGNAQGDLPKMAALVGQSTNAGGIPGQRGTAQLDFHVLPSISTFADANRRLGRIAGERADRIIDACASNRRAGSARHLVLRARDIKWRRRNRLAF